MNPLDLTTFQSLVCFLIGAGSVAIVWGFVTLVNERDDR